MRSYIVIAVYNDGGGKFCTPVRAEGVHEAEQRAIEGCAESNGWTLEEAADVLDIVALVTPSENFHESQNIDSMVTVIV
jgi:hypothetical protein